MRRGRDGCRRCCALMSHTSVGRVINPPGRLGSVTPVLVGSNCTLPSSRFNIMPPEVDNSVPLNVSTLWPRTWSTVIVRSIYFCSSFS